MRVLVTGAAGFVGPHLLAALAARGHEGHGLVLTAGPVPHAASVEVADLLDPAAVRRAIAAVRPEAVVHLAAVSHVPAAEADPRRAVRVNVEGTMALLEAVEALAPAARVLFVSSGDAYGAVEPAEIPIDEATPLRPLSAYGATKAAGEALARWWGRRPGRRLIVARPFNHTGPGQRADFVVPAFARQVAAIAAGVAEPVVRVGDLNPVRDLTDVRDVVRGYVALLERGAPGDVYNLCSGRGVAIRAVLERLLAVAGVRARIETDPRLLRPVQVPRVVGSPRRAQAATGWRAVIDLDATLRDVLAEWRARAGS